MKSRASGRSGTQPNRSIGLARRPPLTLLLTAYLLVWSPPQRSDVDRQGVSRDRRNALLPGPPLNEADGCSPLCATPQGQQFVLAKFRSRGAFRSGVLELRRGLDHGLVVDRRLPDVPGAGAARQEQRLLAAERERDLVRKACLVGHDALGRGGFARHAQAGPPAACPLSAFRRLVGFGSSGASSPPEPPSILSAPPRRILARRSLNPAMKAIVA